MCDIQIETQHSFSLLVTRCLVHLSVVTFLCGSQSLYVWCPLSASRLPIHLPPSCFPIPSEALFTPVYYTDRSFLHLKKHMIRTLYCSPETLSLLKIHYSSLYHLHFKMSFYTVLFVLNIMSGIGFQLSQYFLRVGYCCIKSIITSFGYRKTMNSIIRDAKARQNGVLSSYKKKDNFWFFHDLVE